MSYPTIEHLDDEDDLAVFRAEAQALDEMERKEALALAEERRDREIKCHRAVFSQVRPSGGVEGLKRRIVRLKHDIAAVEQGFELDRIPPKYAERLLWLIDPNANRQPGDESLDPQIIGWLAVIIAEIDW
jgi:hypothetical protein